MSGMSIGGSQLNHSQRVSSEQVDHQKQLETAAAKAAPNEQLSTQLAQARKALESSLNISPEMLDHFAQQIEQAQNDHDKAQAMSSELREIGHALTQQGKSAALPKDILYFMQDHSIPVDGKSVTDFVIGTVKESQNVDVTMTSDNGSTLSLMRIGGEYYQRTQTGFRQVIPELKNGKMLVHSPNGTFSSNIPPASGEGFTKANNIAIPLFSSDGKELVVSHYKGQFQTLGENGYSTINPEINGNQLSFTKDGVTYSNSIPSGLNSVPTREWNNVQLKLTSTHSRQNVYIHSYQGKFYSYGQSGYTEIHPRVEGNIVHLEKDGIDYSAEVPHDPIHPRPNNMTLTLTDPDGNNLTVHNYRGVYSTYGASGYTPIAANINGNVLSITQDGKTYIGKVPPPPLPEVSTMTGAQFNSIEQALEDYVSSQAHEIETSTTQAKQILTDSQAAASQLNKVDLDFSEIQKILNF